MCSDRHRARNFFYACLFVYIILLWGVGYICYGATPDEVAIDLALATMVEPNGDLTNVLG